MEFYVDLKKQTENVIENFFVNENSFISIFVVVYYLV